MRPLHISSILVSFTLLGTELAHAQQPACDPKNFQDVDFTNQSNFFRMLYLDNIDKSHYDQLNAQHHGEMVIPYLNVPAKGDFELTKTIVDQFKELLFKDITSVQQTSVLQQSLTEIGGSAYKACLRLPGPTIYVPSSAIFDAEFYVYVTWNAYKGEVGKFTQPPEADGGQIENTADFNKSLRNHDTIRFKVKNRKLDERFRFSVVINGDAAEIEFPPKPTKTLQFQSAVIPDAAISPGVLEHADNSNGWGGHGHTECFPKGTVPAGSEYVIGSATLVVLKHSGQTDAKVTQPDTAHVCIYVFANAPTSDVGADILAQAFATRAVLVDIDPTKPAAHVFSAPLQMTR